MVFNGIFVYSDERPQHHYRHSLQDADKTNVPLGKLILAPSKINAAKKPKTLSLAFFNLKCQVLVAVAVL
jgi:hypothetical protein